MPEYKVPMHTLEAIQLLLIMLSFPVLYVLVRFFESEFATKWLDRLFDLAPHDLQ
jgi:hypothetical protein